MRAEKKTVSKNNAVFTSPIKKFQFISYKRNMLDS